jgi:hypothetical protein
MLFPLKGGPYDGEQHEIPAAVPFLHLQAKERPEAHRPDDPRVCERVRVFVYKLKGDHYECVSR